MVKFVRLTLILSSASEKKEEVVLTFNPLIFVLLPPLMICSFITGKRSNPMLIKFVNEPIRRSLKEMLLA